MSMQDEGRKLKEAEFHNRRERLRDENPEEYVRITKNQRFYSINQTSKEFMDDWLRAHCGPGTRALDYCCGTGGTALFMAQCGAEVTGIDISEESVHAAEKRLADAGLAGRAQFKVGDAENTLLAAGSFDVVLCNGVLHHLDVTKAFPELARIVKPTGSVFCVEALAHNPVFQLYRRLTPQMRTAWETDHILSREKILGARQWFESVDPHFFHLAELAAVPLRTSPSLFQSVRPALRWVDERLLTVPGLRWWAWQCLFVLSQPKRA